MLVKYISLFAFVNEGTKRVGVLHRENRRRENKRPCGRTTGSCKADTIADPELKLGASLSARPQ